MDMGSGVERESPIPVLIVDDEPSVVAIVSRMLSTTYDITGVTSPLKALEVLARKPHHVLITDLIMREMDGISLLKASLPIYPRLVGIVMSGVATVPTAVEAMKAGALDVLVKPIRPAEINVVITRALGTRQQRIDELSLTHQAVRRTGELENDRRSMEGILEVVSHDMRAPLEGIAACIDLVKDMGVSPEALPMCDAIRKEALELSQLASDLIDSTRLARGHFIWRWGMVDPVEVVRAVVATLGALAAKSRVTLREGAIAAVPFHGDERACRRLVTNLVNNAIRHAKAREITVACTGDADQVQFTIADNGRGISPSMRETLGRPFAAEGPAGFGLGLGISISIATAHGGHLDVFSRVGRGTTIRATLRGDLLGPQPFTGQEAFGALDLEDAAAG